MPESAASMECAKCRRTFTVDEFFDHECPPTSAATREPIPTLRLWLINNVLKVTLRCSCGWSESFDNGIEFGPVGYAATTHNREAHGA